MDELWNVIIKLFRYVLPDEILSGSILYNDIHLEVLERLSYAYESQSDEAENRKKLRYLKDWLGFDAHEESNSTAHETRLDVFNMVNCFARDTLVNLNEEVVCHFEHLQTWRMVMNKVDSNIFVAAKYAEIDWKNGKVRNTFLWPDIIGHDNVQLSRILSSGISDNHFHLHASVHYFNLSWLYLMNKTTDARIIKQLRKMDRQRRTLKIKQSQTEQEQSFFTMHLQAALIRVFLYSELTGRKIRLKPYYAPWKWLVSYIFSSERIPEFFQRNKSRTISSEDILRYCPGFFWLVTSKLQERGCIIQWEGSNGVQAFVENPEAFFYSLYGREIPLEDCAWLFDSRNEEIYNEEWKKQTLAALNDFLTTRNLLDERGKIQRIIDSFFIDQSGRDYAMNAAGSWYKKDKIKAMMAGEYWLLYTMFRRKKDSSSGLSNLHYNLFYAYLVIKENFRMEMLQSNDRIGFTNFREYQRRKGWFNAQYTLGELACLAVDAAMDRQPVKCLEIRIKPEKSCAEDARMLRIYEEALKQYRKENKEFYYVFHFSRSKDDTLIQNDKEFSHMFYRHYALRKRVRREAEAIIQLRKKNPELACRVLGIDTCSEEDGCRPEVFATAYRILKNHSCYRGLSLKPEIPRLGLTYHVGEVFQDVVDGLRAIDEAVLFLNLSYGDRLGHATVLGIHVEKWYKESHYEITIRKQDYLDNVVWLYQKLIRYQISGMEALLEYLKSEFQLYFSVIYGKCLEETYIARIIQEACSYDGEYGEIGENESIPYEFNINLYYYSWMLRGDHPELYARGYYRRNSNIKTLWEEYSINRSYPNEQKIRYILPAVILNHYYHYDYSIKYLGEKSITVKIPANMVSGIELVQREMQKELADREIAIETNPSSNVMISRIKSYEEHPIVQFYNKGLTRDLERLDACAQMNVSINTDDQGVFSTNLANEYALIVSSLGQLRDVQGNHLYKKSDIYDWIKAIQEMGNQQSFFETKINYNRTKKER